jgi:hypothetical protein
MYIGSKKSITDAMAMIDKPPINNRFKQETFTLAKLLYETIGVQTSVHSPYFAMVLINLN